MRLGGSLARRRGGRPPSKKGPGKKAGARGRKSLWRVALGLALAGWAGGYIFSTTVLFPAAPPLGDLFEVPDIRGLGLASAQERLAGTGLQLGPIDSLSHPTVARSLVVGQSPLPGQLARPEAAVGVTISLGSERRSIPDVAGIQEDRARIILESSGFTVSIETEQAEAPRGSVMGTRPTANSALALPAEVRMIVSTGPPKVRMPLVLGLERSEAMHILDSLGLIVTEVTEVFRFGRDQGIVVEQEPAADSELDVGSGVRLSVGRRGREREH